MNFRIICLIVMSVSVICKCTGLPYRPTTYPTTPGPPTTTAECKTGDSTQRNCYAFYCYNGRWQPFEFIKSEHCCKTHLPPHPMCYEIFPELGSTPSWIG